MEETIKKPKKYGMSGKKNMEYFLETCFVFSDVSCGLSYEKMQDVECHLALLVKMVGVKNFIFYGNNEFLNFCFKIINSFKKRSYKIKITKVNNIDCVDLNPVDYLVISSNEEQSFLSKKIVHDLLKHAHYLYIYSNSVGKIIDGFKDRKVIIDAKENFTYVINKGVV